MDQLAETFLNREGVKETIDEARAFTDTYLNSVLNSEPLTDPGPISGTVEFPEKRHHQALVYEHRVDLLARRLATLVDSTEIPEDHKDLYRYFALREIMWPTHVNDLSERQMEFHRQSERGYSFNPFYGISYQQLLRAEYDDENVFAALTTFSDSDDGKLDRQFAELKNNPYGHPEVFDVLPGFKEELARHQQELADSQEFRNYLDGLRAYANS